MLWVILIILAAIIWLEVPELTRQKKWRELVVFTVLMTMGTAILIPLALGIEVPSPSKAVEAVFAPFTQWMKQ